MSHMQCYSLTVSMHAPILLADSFRRQVTSSSKDFVISCNFSRWACKETTHGSNTYIGSSSAGKEVRDRKKVRQEYVRHIR